MANVPPVWLDRRFVEIRGKDCDDASFSALVELRSNVGWNDLLRKPRVVVLAEAGSGKTTEFRAQAEKVGTDGRFAFYATVQDVGRQGLIGALDYKSQRQLSSWQTSDQPGWFFIDSIDEGKWDNISLRAAVRALANGLCDAADRAHVLLSGRYSDWDFERDLATFAEELPTPTPQASPTPPTEEELLARVVRDEKLPEPAKPELPSLFLMASLDQSRVRTYASARQIADLEPFLAAIAAGNLWRFARRPRDLSWMVDFWCRHRRLGSLAEMLEASLDERIRESNLAYSRHDKLDPAECWAAIERIGAAMVFGTANAVTLPTEEIQIVDARGALDVTRVLPDWSPTDCARLLGRAAFDPATFGRVRLHNDNEGTVRAYLAARWLWRLKMANLPQRVLHELLFADIYGQSLIKPSVRETAAWLALRDPAIAQEIISRNPFALLDQGDPTSLTLETRQRVLRTIVVKLAEDSERLPILDQDRLRHFSTPDLCPTIHALWREHGIHPQVRQLLVEIIWLGGLSDCVSIVADVALDDKEENTSRIFAVRALVTIADRETKTRLAKHIIENASKLWPAIVWDAVDGLFPEYLSIPDLLHLIDAAEDQAGYGFSHQAEGWVDRLNDPSDIANLLSGLLDRIKPPDLSRIGEHDPNIDRFASVLAAGSLRLLHRSPDGSAPPEAIDAMLAINNDHYKRRNPRGADDAALDELRRTSERRRASFWRAGERLQRLRPSIPINIWQIDFFTWEQRLQLADIDWLLADGISRTSAGDRALAIEAVLHIWRINGADKTALQKITATASTEPDLQAALAAALAPATVSEGRSKTVKEAEALKRRAEKKQAEIEASWAQFINERRADPDAVRNTPPPDANGVDANLFQLWRLASNACCNGNRYSLDDLSPIEPAFGRALTDALRDALCVFWRRWTPRLKSAREPAVRNQVSMIDCMALAGAGLDAARTPMWATTLSDEEARLATRLATLELNGFPKWLTPLAEHAPLVVAQVLIGEIDSELADVDPSRHREVLWAVRHAHASIRQAIAPQLRTRLQDRTDLPVTAIEQVIGIATNASIEDRESVADFLFDQLGTIDAPEISTIYMAAAFALRPDDALLTLQSRLESLAPSDQTAWVQRLLPRLFGAIFIDLADQHVILPFAVLEKLVRIAFHTIRPEDDRVRPSRGAYSPDGRDHAEQARGGAFSRLAQTPGRATYDALLRFAELPDFPLPAHHLRELAMRRAAEDSEDQPWTADDAYRFERTHEHMPATGRELQHLAMRRIDEIQYDLANDDLSQAEEVKTLPDETRVQVWTALQLRQRARSAYTLEREPHVIGEKEPDIRLRTKDGCSVAIEMKIAENWTLPQLEGALVNQLSGQYLRASETRHGILLLVHKTSRNKGWKDPTTGKMLNFPQVVERLRALADATASESPDAPQPVVAVLDVATETFVHRFPRCAGNGNPVPGNPAAGESE